MGERVLEVAVKGSRKHALVRFFAVIRQPSTLSGYKRCFFVSRRPVAARGINGAANLHVTTGYDII
jgi:hypothetical protein